MSEPVRVQLKRTKGWRMPENTVKVDRSTRWGNPFKVHGDGYPMDPKVAVMLFRKQLLGNGFVMPDDPTRAHLTTIDDVRTWLAGKNLACWCPLDQPCHADVLLELANGPTRAGK